MLFMEIGGWVILASGFAQILKCLRCGACLFSCQVIRLVGGHAYRAVYPGPLGIVLSPLLAGEEFCKYADLPKACSLCGGCAEVCPAKIPLPSLIVQMRDEAKRRHCKIPNDVGFKAWSFIATTPRLWKFGIPFNRLANYMPIDKLRFGTLGRWMKARKLPKFKGGEFRKWFKKNG